MNWQNIFENAVSNTIADVLVGLVAATIITLYFSRKSDLKGQIGALTIIDAEIQVNLQILESLLNDAITALEEYMGRNTHRDLIANSKDVNYLNDIAQTLQKPIDHLQFGAFNASFKDLSSLDNKELLEKVLNLYTVSFAYRLKLGLSIGGLSWPLIDEIKKAILRETKEAKQTRKIITSELSKLSGKSKFLEIMKYIFWKGERSEGK